jgi:hypothetical protein
LSDAPRRKLRDLLAESVVVVLSILIAFGLDAWWESQRERQNLALDLERVLEEVSAARAAVITQVGSYRRIVAGSEALLAEMDASRDAPTVSVPDTLAYLASLLPTLNPRMSTVEAFLGSGRLATVADRDLRAALASLPGRMEDAVVPIERQRDVFFSVHQAELGRELSGSGPFGLHLTAPGRHDAPAAETPSRYTARTREGNEPRRCAC